MYTYVCISSVDFRVANCLVSCESSVMYHQPTALLSYYIIAAANGYQPIYDSRSWYYFYECDANAIFTQKHDLLHKPHSARLDTGFLVKKVSSHLKFGMM